ncbi:13737_t:CDS:2, partial [Gigaspora margarita]
YHELGRHYKALCDLNRFLDIYPNDKDMLRFQEEVMIDISTKLLKMYPNNEEALQILSIRAQAYTAIGNYEKASVDLNRLLEINPRNTKALKYYILMNISFLIDKESSYNKFKNFFDA